MSLRVVGAGLPRTGTMSLKRMLEQLLGAGCYHMHELWQRAETDVPLWLRIFDDDLGAIDEVLDGWGAAVDWPVSAAWRQIAERHPQALVILSHRGDAATWWKSADATVWEAMRRWAEGGDPLFDGWNDRLRQQAGFSADLADGDAAMARYQEHFAEVVATIAPERLLLWQPGDGWEPICDRLGLPVPDADPLHINSTAEFRERARFDD